MKKILQMALIFATTIVLASCSKDNEPENPNGNDKYLSEIIVMEYTKAFGEYSDNRCAQYASYKYNPDGTLAEMEALSGKPTDLKTPDHYTYKYDEKKRLIERHDHSYITTERLRKYEYNSMDSVSRILVYGKDGKLKNELTHEYDSQGRLVKIVDNDYIFTGSTSEYTYEPNTVRVVKRWADGRLFGTFVYTYDSRKNLLQEVYISGNDGKESISQKYEYTYDTEGRIKRKTILDNRMYDWRFYDYEYNDNGTINMIRVSDPEKGEESELRYEYIYK